MAEVYFRLKNFLQRNYGPVDANGCPHLVFFPMILSEREVMECCTNQWSGSIGVLYYADSRNGPCRKQCDFFYLDDIADKANWYQNFLNLKEKYGMGNAVKCRIGRVHSLKLWHYRLIFNVRDPSDHIAFERFLRHLERDIARSIYNANLN